MKIFKYELGILEKQTIRLPIGADILRVDDVDGRFYLWALVDPDAVLEDVELVAFKTGGQIDYKQCELQYLGFAKIFIQMELCLYFFKVRKLKVNTFVEENKCEHKNQKLIDEYTDECLDCGEIIDPYEGMDYK